MKDSLYTRSYPAFHMQLLMNAVQESIIAVRMHSVKTLKGISTALAQQVSMVMDSSASQVYYQLV